MHVGKTTATIPPRIPTEKSGSHRENGHVFIPPVPDSAVNVPTVREDVVLGPGDDIGRKGLLMGSSKPG
jgi:hypothetical protein